MVAQAELCDPPERRGEDPLNNHALVPMLRHRRERALELFDFLHAGDVKSDAGSLRCRLRLFRQRL